MIRSNHNIHICVIAVFALFFLITAQVQANQFKDNIPSEELEQTIEAYFETRYLSLSNLKLEDLWMMSKPENSNSSMLSESDKLEIEIQHAKLNNLRYVEYEFYLDFREISMDPDQETATVSVVEGHDVIFEVSKEISNGSPIVSSMRNLQHTIIIHKYENEWKIVSDSYDDYLWRLIRTAEISKQEMLALVSEPTSKTAIKPDNRITSLCSLPNDESTHPYNRDGAIAYAHRWALDRNPKYFDFENFGGDCTNFVNQAIYERGSGGQMVGHDTLGWYYYDQIDKSASWTDVGKLHEFITDYLVWPAGPEGCSVESYEANEGDLIQYDWTNNAYWDHSVIIVESEDFGQDDRFHWVASHTPDLDNYPFTHFKFDYPGLVMRFMHIERIDGYALNFIPLVLNNSGAKLSDQQNISYSDPYPAPIENDKKPEPLSPYPAP